MISRNCRYSYYGDDDFEPAYEEATVERIIHLLHTKKVAAIIGYKYGILIETVIQPMKISNLGVNLNSFCKYNYELLSFLWDESFGCQDVINSYLGQKCKNKREMQTIFMAKVLGEK